MSDVLNVLPAFPLILSPLISGLILSISIIAVPPLTLAPTPILLQQYVDLYRRGRNTAPALVLANALLSFYLAYTAETALKMQLWAACGALNVGIAPFTMIVMKNVNGTLYAREAELRTSEEKEKEKWKVSEKEVGELMKRWKWMNFARGVMPLMGAVAGWMAYVS